jgi:hypothetical protein
MVKKRTSENVICKQNEVWFLGFGLGTTSVSTEVVLGNRYGSVGTTEIENRIFGFFFFAFQAAEDPASITV